MPRNDFGRPADPAARLDRLESTDDIRQLVHRYALAIDSRNLDDLVELFVDDVRVGDRTGREALRAWFLDALARIGPSIHFVGNHVIEFDGPDRATGIVYCRDEVERGADWAYGYIQYWDRYERRDGRWYFVRRRFHRWFMVDALARPRAGAGIDADGLTTGRLPEAWPSWARFWNEVGHGAPRPDPNDG